MANGNNKAVIDAKLKDDETVTVRMYRGILGDFFVLSHVIGTGPVYRALIDCGALQCIGSRANKPATAASLDQLETCITSLLDEGSHFNLVIATHEHYDHLSGFVKYNDQFTNAGFSIGELWLAWTENDADQLAVAIREGRSKGIEALNALVASDAAAKSFGLKLDDKKVRSQIDGLRDLMQFNGELDPDAAQDFADKLVKAKPASDPAKKRPRSCRDALNWLKQLAKEPNVRYLDPGQQVQFGHEGRLRASVLGPPRTRDRLLKMDPSAGGKVSEVYLTDRDDYLALLTTMSTRQQVSRARKGQAMDGAGSALPDDVEIFEPVDTDSPFKDFGPGPKVSLTKNKQGHQRVDSDWRVAELYYDPDNASRRIDGDWLGVAQTLALKIDGDVNNTSLALAIEVPGRQVLLFPADAQVGNWLSWHDQDYPSKPNVKTGTGETAADILSRVVLYKVGHHGSHNATARAMGLELMTNPHLVALIPVVEEVAKEQKNSSNPHGWAMPYDDLYTRLMTKTAGRIVRGDGDLAAEQAAFGNSIFTLDYSKDSDVAPTWVSLTLKGGTQ